MDTLEKFLHSIAYKFPKGYPDMKNEQDVLILENEFKKIGIDLKELETNKNHWQDRVNERGTILDIINFPKDYPISKQEVIKQIQDELNLRSNRLLKLKDFPASINYQVGYKLMKPILIYENNRIPLELKTEYSKNEIKKTNTGTSYVAIINDNILNTLLLLMDDDDLTIETNMKDHQKREGFTKPIKITTNPEYEFIITPEVENISTLIDPQSLPYKLRTDYRKGADFEHDTYGKGTIINTSAGSGGKGDSRGKLEWVEVDFGKPYVQGGQLKKTRIINNIYTLLSPDVDI
jgi:hypothetical protein